MLKSKGPRPQAPCVRGPADPGRPAHHPRGADLPPSSRSRPARGSWWSTTIRRRPWRPWRSSSSWRSTTCSSCPSRKAWTAATSGSPSPPGKGGRVPDAIATVIDLGHRCIDISTFLEIIDRLGLSDPDVDRRLLRYAEGIVTLDMGVNRQYKELYLKHAELTRSSTWPTRASLLVDPAGRHRPPQPGPWRRCSTCRGMRAGAPTSILPPAIQEVLARKSGREWIVEHRGALARGHAPGHRALRRARGQHLQLPRGHLHPPAGAGPQPQAEGEGPRRALQLQRRPDRLPPDAAVRGTGPADRRIGLHGADPWGERDGQGAPGPVHPRCVLPEPAGLRGRQLRRRAREPPGERALRLRGRLVHRRSQGGQAGPLRAGAPRDGVPGRGRGHAPGAAGQAAAGAAGAADHAGWGPRRSSASTSA